MIILGLKVIFLFIAIMFTFVNVMRTISKNDVPSLNFALQSIGITGFITLQFLI